MVLEVYPDAVSAGAAVFDRYDKVADPATGKKLSRTGWLALHACCRCRRRCWGACSGGVLLPSQRVEP